MKRILLILLIGLISLEMTGCKTEKVDKDNSKPYKELFMLGLTLDDGRHVSFTFNVPYQDNDVSTLFDGLMYYKITVTAFLKHLELIDTLKDGGSQLYKYNTAKKIFGNEEFYAMACNSLDNNKDIYIAKNKENLMDKCSLKIDDLENVAMKIKEGTLMRTGATVIITDTSDRENIYGEGYALEKKVNDTWVQLKPKSDMVFVSIGYHVDDNHTLELKINWDSHYGALEDGIYRILKSISEAGEGTNHYITSEFMIG